MTLVARFTSHCGICDVKILPGDEIEMIDGEPCHADCAEDGDFLEDEA